MAKVSVSGVKVTGSFGPRKPIKTKAGWSSSFHKGVDLAPAVPEREDPLFAPGDYVVWYANKDSTGANDLFMGTMQDGWRFVHNSRHHVRAGQRVRAGQHVADMGRTGKATGVHVHIERYINGVAVDPWPHLNALGNSPIDPKDSKMTPEQFNALIFRLDNLVAITLGGGPDMPDGQSSIASQVNNISAAIFHGGPSTGGESMVAKLDSIRASQLDRAVVYREVGGKTVQVSALQELADAKTSGIRSEAAIATLASTIPALAGGTTVDASVVKEQVEQAVRAAFEGQSLTVTIGA